MIKITVNRKCKDLTRTEPHYRCLPRKVPRILKVILDDVFQTCISTDKNILNVTSISSIDAFIIISGRIFVCMT